MARTEETQTHAASMEHHAGDPGGLRDSRQRLLLLHRWVSRMVRTSLAGGTLRHRPGPVRRTLVQCSKGCSVKAFGVNECSVEDTQGRVRRAGAEQDTP